MFKKSIIMTTQFFKLISLIQTMQIYYRFPTACIMYILCVLSLGWSFKGFLFFIQSMFISPIRNIYSGFVFQMLSGMHLLSFATDVNVILRVLFFHNEGTGPISNNYIPSISFFLCVG